SFSIRQPRTRACAASSCIGAADVSIGAFCHAGAAPPIHSRRSWVRGIRMRPVHTIRFPAVLLAALLGAAGCMHATSSAPVRARESAPAAAMPAANDGLNAVLWVQASAEYRAVAETIYRAATGRLEAALQDP